MGNYCGMGGKKVKTWLRWDDKPKIAPENRYNFGAIWKKTRDCAKNKIDFIGNQNFM